MANPVIFLINVDWFFRSHFYHLAQKARRDGRHVILISQMVSNEGFEGLEIVPLQSERAGFRPRGLASAVDIVDRTIERFPTANLHAFGAYGVVVGTLATRKRRTQRLIFHITGRGFVAASQSIKARVVRRLLQMFYSLADGDNVHWIAENAADLKFFGLHDHSRAVLVPGAGVDTARYQCAPISQGSKLKLGFVARLIHSKGLDLAVRAVELARARGHDIEMSVAGGPDRGNPSTLSERTVQQLTAADYITYVGYITHVQEFWAQHDVAILPSRGGEGVPKSLLEAASCGRPMITTTVPGCLELARDTGGWTVPPERVDLLADAIANAAEEKASGRLSMRGAQSAAIARHHLDEEFVWSLVRAQYI